MKNIVKNIIPLLTFLIIVIFGQSIVLVTKANPELPGSDITIYSPQNNMNYNSDFHLLNFSISTINDFNNGTKQAWYNLDGQGDTPVSIECETIGSILGLPYSWFWGIADLPQLSFGEHSIKVSIKYDFGDFILTDRNTVTFNVENSTMLKPSIPEFTIRTQTQANTTTITLTIRNQPFDAASQYPNGLFYNVAIRVDGNWSDLYHVEDASDWYPQQSNSSTTVLTYLAGETMYYPMNTSQGVGIIPKSGEVAFKVQAMIGHRDRGAFQNGFIPYVLVGEEGDWSNTQTIVIPTSSSSSSTSESSDADSFPIIPITASIGIIAIVSVGLLIYFKKRKQ